LQSFNLYFIRLRFQAVVASFELKLAWPMPSLFCYMHLTANEHPEYHYYNIDQTCKVTGDGCSHIVLEASHTFETDLQSEVSKHVQPLKVLLTLSVCIRTWQTAGHHIPAQSATVVPFDHSTIIQFLTVSLWLVVCYHCMQTYTINQNYCILRLVSL
jgi:hypothetical protein